MRQSKQAEASPRLALFFALHGEEILHGEKTLW
jgi:hypothetical protein